MPADFVGIVYGVGDCLIHKIIVPDRDGELDDPAWLPAGNGELMLRIPRTLFAMHDNHLSLALVIGLLG